MSPEQRAQIQLRLAQVEKERANLAVRATSPKLLALDRKVSGAIVSGKATINKVTGAIEFAQAEPTAPPKRAKPATKKARAKTVRRVR